MEYRDRKDHWSRYRNMIMLLTYMLHYVFTLTSEPRVFYYPGILRMSRKIIMIKI